ncbi:MAG: valine--tRNA ligase [Elusimicrobiales bacterium]|nr:valine--tRNA ligase [Elusimicrobiales bacterium]
MLGKTYEPQKIELKWSELWQEKKLFSSKPDDSKESFTIVIPPPNLTGALHIGHAFNNTLQDILIRYKRMTGYETYWVPGTDHGGIATQNVLEKVLKAEGKTKNDLGRKKFIEKAWQWREECGDEILNQLKKLGCSLDISKENIRFTMDEQRAQAVFEAFKSLWDKKHIYRGERMINWCPRCGTALSDIEVEYEEEKSKLWHIHYPLENGGKGLIVATTRPETMLGDTAVAVNPKDERYSSFIGKKLKLPLTGRIIPIIADRMVEKDFGTGAVKITPSHDINDFEMGKRHNLENIRVISYEGRIINSPEKYLDKSVQAARKLILEDLKELGFLDKEEHYKHSVSKCYRCNNNIEPLVSEQWFIRMENMAKPAIKAAEKEEIKFYPPSWKKPFIDWIENIQDWCISRQIWWGHRIPVWYCKECSAKGLKFSEEGNLSRISFKNGAKPIVSFDKPEKCPQCSGQNLLQDPDVLDTWFSSALWPFSVFNWPEKSKDLDFYYPTSVLVTGYEILYLWVARMLMSGIEHMGKVPFPNVYIHGIVRDKHGKKMSKSLGNVIDPLLMMNKYGTDAVRFSLIFHAIGGKDIQFSEDIIIGGRNFINKLYNVSRFLMMGIKENEKIASIETNRLKLADKWILHKYNKALSDVRENMDKFDAANALNAIYTFFWDDFCDWYIELAKHRLETNERNSVLAVLLHIFTGSIKTMHPFIPYITEELFLNTKKYISSSQEFLLDNLIDEPDKKFINETCERQMKSIMGIITQIRILRAQFEISHSKKVNAVITSKNSKALEALKENADYIALLAKIENLEIIENAKKPEMSASAISESFSIYIPMGGLIDIEKEKKRLVKEYDKTDTELALWNNKLKNENFIKFAPKQEIDKINQRKTDSLEKIEKLKILLESFK